MRIGDKQVRDAIEVIIAELENAEAMVSTLHSQVQTLEHTIEMKDIEIDKMMDDIQELDSEVKRLDDLLVDKMITSVDPKAPPRES